LTKDDSDKMLRRAWRIKGEFMDQRGRDYPPFEDCKGAMVTRINRWITREILDELDSMKQGDELWRPKAMDRRGYPPFEDL
jgi:hypothetical protein